MGGPGAGDRLAVINHCKGKRLHIGKLGRHSDRWGADGEGVCGISGKLYREALGSALHGVETGNVCERSQHKKQGEQMCTDDKQAFSEGNMHRMRYHFSVTEHPDGAGGCSGDGTTSATAGQCVRGVSTGD